MKIAIFGGSFDPIHEGHINIANTAINELGLDKLYFVPAFKSPFKNKVKYANPENRIDMINLVLPNKCEVSNFEIDRKGVSYTIDTVSYFKQKFPNAEISIIIGTDHINRLHKWKEIEKINDMVNITVFKREGEFSKMNIKKFGCTLLNNEKWDVSSSNIRKGNFDNLNPKVQEYIAEKNLYLEEISVSFLSAKRHKHCIATGHMAAELAKANSYNAKKAWVAGFMHDITKEWNTDEQKKFLDSMNYEFNEVPDSILHQWTGAVWLEQVYKLKDREIIDSIYKHSNADGYDFNSLTLLDKIVYLSDKLCDGRKYPGINEHRKLAFKDIDKAFEAVSKERQKKYVDDIGKQYVLKRKV